MNNKNHFVSRYDMLSGVRINYTLQDIIEEYQDITREIEEYQLQKEKYERQLEKEIEKL